MPRPRACRPWGGPSPCGQSPPHAAPTRRPLAHSPCADVHGPRGGVAREDLPSRRHQPHRPRGPRRHGDRRRDVPLEPLRVFQNRLEHGRHADGLHLGVRRVSFSAGGRTGKETARRPGKQRVDDRGVRRGLHDRGRQHGGIWCAADGHDAPARTAPDDRVVRAHRRPRGLRRDSDQTPTHQPRGTRFSHRHRNRRDHPLDP